MVCKLFIFLVFIILVLIFSTSISAICEEGMININNADKNELDNLYGVGPATAQNIIDSRPYNSVDDLIKAKGIGEIKLETIKSQGLACVDNEETEEKKIDEEKDLKELTEVEEKPEEIIVEGIIEQKPPEIIKLNPQIIKSSIDNNLDKGRYAIFSIIGLCLLMIILFFFKKNRYKNEFQR